MPKWITSSILAPILVGTLFLFLSMLQDISMLKANEENLQDSVREIKIDVKFIRNHIIERKK